jgi:signal transduction histidine kinase
MTDPAQGGQLRRLLQVGRALVAEHDSEAVLDRILDEAREITGAQYVALGVLNEHRTELERFITVGVGETTRRAIGELPHGRGVLGTLIEDPRPLRLSDVGDHPQSYGFPPAHPPMHSFLGVPIVIRGEAWGNLYLTEKEGGTGFTDEDEEAVVALAQWAGTAIENARLYESSEQRREQLERAVRALEAARDIADAVSLASDLERVLELIVKRGRALVDARTVLIMLREGDELVVAASAGHSTGARGNRVPISRSVSGQVLERGRAERITDVASQLRIAPGELSVGDARCALLVPMLHRGTALGVLAAFDRVPEQGAFSAEDEQLLRTFAASAANAVAINRSVEADRLRSAIAAADAERSRWARELHDQTLQALGGLRVLLASASSRGDAATKDQAIIQAIEDIELEIGNLRGIITDLRPSMLDDLGLQPAIEALLERRREAGLDIVSRIELPPEGTGLAPELETTIYRVIQEALTNVAKHASANSVRVSVRRSDREVVVEVRDDGVGFDTTAHTQGFGLAGMRERVYLAGGTLQVGASAHGTGVSARLPIRRRSEDAPRSSDEVASERKSDQLGTRGEAELAMDPPAVRLHGSPG